MNSLRRAILLILLCSWLGTPAAWAAQVSVAMAPENTVSGPRILLGDVAFIDILVPEASSLAAALGRIDLGPAPEAGQTETISRSELEARLKASRLDLTEVVWSLPEELVLTGQGQSLNEKTLAEVLEKYLAETEPYRSGHYSLERVNFSSLPTLPPGELSYHFEPGSSSNPAYLTGTFFFAVDGRQLARSRVTAQVDLSVEAVVAVRDLPKGHILAEEDLSLTLVPYSQAKDALNDPALAVGATLKNKLRAGEAVKERSLGKSLMVRRGEMVSIIAQAGGLKVSASGQARQDGALGETITVTNLDSKKNINARVIGPSTVEVIF